MEISSAAQMRRAIHDLQIRVQRLEEWQALDAELAGREVIAAPSHNPRRAPTKAAQGNLAERIADRYEHIRSRMPAWKDAINRGDCIEAPLVLSKVTPGWTPRDRRALVEAAPPDFEWFRQPPPGGSSYARTYRPGTDMPWIRLIIG